MDHRPWRLGAWTVEAERMTRDGGLRWCSLSSPVMHKAVGPSIEVSQSRLPVRAQCRVEESKHQQFSRTT